MHLHASSCVGRTSFLSTDCRLYTHHTHTLETQNSVVAMLSRGSALRNRTILPRVYVWHQSVYMIEKGGAQQPHQAIFQQRHIQTSVVVGLLSGFRVCFFLFILWLRASRESSNWEMSSSLDVCDALKRQDGGLIGNWQWKKSGVALRRPRWVLN